MGVREEEEEEGERRSRRSKLHVAPHVTPLLQEEEERRRRRWASGDRAEVPGEIDEINLTPPQKLPDPGAPHPSRISSPRPHSATQFENIKNTGETNANFLLVTPKTLINRQIDEHSPLWASITSTRTIRADDDADDDDARREDAKGAKQ